MSIVFSLSQFQKLTMTLFFALVSCLALCSKMMTSFPLGTSRESMADSTTEISSHDGQSTNTPEQALENKFVQLVNVTIIENTGLCVPPVIDGVFNDMGCKPEVRYHLQKNRIPRLLAHVECADSPPRFRFRSRKVERGCEEVRYNMNVLYSNGTTDEIAQYWHSVESVSVACVRSTLPKVKEPEDVLIVGKLT